MQVIVQADGKRRLLMVRDVAAPAWTSIASSTPPILGQGPCTCAYRDTRERGRVMGAMYGVPRPMSFKYFMRTRSTKRRCVTFHLDYDRQSDLTTRSAGRSNPNPNLT